METKKKPKLITITHTAIGVKFSPGNPSLVTVAGFDAEKLSSPLAKFFARVAKSGSDGVKVKTLDKDDRWSARFLLKIHALKDIPEPTEEKKVTKKPAKAAAKPATVKSKARHTLAKAA